MSARQKALHHGEQCDMFAMFDAGETAKRTGELPTNIDAAGPLFLAILQRYNAATLAKDTTAAELASDDADNLAIAMNGTKGRLGIKGGDGAPCYLLQDFTAVPDGEIPIHGQKGIFIITIEGFRVSVDYGGIFGSGDYAFSVRIVDKDRPFPISDTGYRSFCGLWNPGGRTVEAFVTAVLEAHLKDERKPKSKPGKKRLDLEEGCED